MKFLRKDRLESDAQWHGLVIDGKFLKIGTDETIALSHIKSISFSKESYYFLHFHIILFFSSLVNILFPQSEPDRPVFMVGMGIFGIFALISYWIGLNSKLMISLTGSSKIVIFKSHNEANVRALKSALEDSIEHRVR